MMTVSKATLFALCVVAGLVAVAADPPLPPAVEVSYRVRLPHENFTQKIPGSVVKYDMVFVPGGEFTLGSPDDETGRSPDEGPQRRVKLRPFWLGKCEVTWDEFYLWFLSEDLFQPGDQLDEVLQKPAAPDALTRPTNTYVDEYYDHGVKGFPAISMTHHAAMMYCHWLRWKTKLPYRLPTEAEWEYACRAGHDGAYGFEADGKRLEDYAWFRDNSPDADHPDGTTHKVGTRKPNRWGLHDMHGNVAEWCLDRYDGEFYKQNPKVNPLLGPVNVPTKARWSNVTRGGSWADGRDRLRSAARRASDKTWQKYDANYPQSVWWLTKMDVIGFRVALPADESPELVGLKPLVPKKE
ncbi:MAG: formylglycine-generating enzyme family protein [Fimbriiglobus sp.]